MKSKEELAEDWYEEGKFKSDFPRDKTSFIEGYKECEKLLKKYIHFVDYEDGSTFLFRKNDILTEEEREHLFELYGK